MVKISTDIHGNTGFPGVKEPCGPDIACSITWADRYLGGTSQHYMPLQWAQKVCIHGLIQYKWPEH